MSVSDREFRLVKRNLKREESYNNWLMMIHNKEEKYIENENENIFTTIGQFVSLFLLFTVFLNTVFTFSCQK